MENGPITKQILKARERLARLRKDVMGTPMTRGEIQTELDAIDLILTSAQAQAQGK